MSAWPTGTSWGLGLLGEHLQLNTEEPEQKQVKLSLLAVCSFSPHYEFNLILKRQLLKPRTYWTWHQSSYASLGLIKDFDMGWSTFSESPWLLPRTAAGMPQPPLPNKGVAIRSLSWVQGVFPASFPSSMEKHTPKSEDWELFSSWDQPGGVR